MPSDRCSRRISAQSSTFNTLQTMQGGQVSPIAWGSVFTSRRQLLKNIDAASPWSTADLIEASDWLQRRIAEHTASQQALTVLAGQGRTKRIRNTAHARLGQPPA
jgi:hypothetical protein